MNILQVSTADIVGGAEKIAWNLFQAYRAHGHNSWLAVGSKRSNHPDVLVMRGNRSETPWGRISVSLGQNRELLRRKLPGLWRIPRICKHPWREVERRLGIEDFNYPESRKIIEMLPQKPDIVHCHNLHGGYFDLRLLPWLSQQVATILTLHDAWLLSGHCAHSLACERWKSGCGHCPDLTLHPAIQRDASAYNWRRKRNIYTQSRVYVATPCEWLMRKVEQSVLAPAVVEGRVIPNGIDLSVFRPANKQAVRAALGIPQDILVLLFAANGIHRNKWKDYQTMRNATALVAEKIERRDLLFIALGENAPAERIGRAQLRFVPYEEDSKAVAQYYQAADLYLHAARAETFPNTVLEALACGTPVVATAVGGIPEQVRGLAVGEQSQTAKLNLHNPSEGTGILVPASDAVAMADSIALLMNNNSLRCQIGENAARDARLRFDLKRQVDSYLEWYERIQSSGKHPREIHSAAIFPSVTRRLSPCTTLDVTPRV